jgi:hypothetical protein
LDVQNIQQKLRSLSIEQISCYQPLWFQLSIFDYGADADIELWEYSSRSRKGVKLKESDPQLTQVLEQRMFVEQNKTKKNPSTFDLLQMTNSRPSA